MRSLWLASAALCLTAGVAMAQTTTTAPAPTGAPNGAAASPAPGAPPGNMAPSHATTGADGSMSPEASAGAGKMSSGGMSSNAPTPPSDTGGLTSGAPGTAATSSHYNGQDSVSPPAGQAMSAGAPPEGHMASSTAGSGMARGARAYGGEPRLPANADASTYLGIASRAIKNHDRALAEEALSNAETVWLTRSVPASSGATVDDSPAVTAIEHARRDLAAGDYQTAASDTREALHAHHGMVGEGGMNGSGMSGGSDMSSPMSDEPGGPGVSGRSGAGAMGGPTQ